MRKMKDSGIRFVGNIPLNWRVENNKHCFKMEKEIVGEESNNIQLLSLTKKGIICKDLNSVGGKVPDSFDTYQKVKNGQIVLCLFDLDCSAVFSGLSNYDGMISPAYKVYNCCENIYNRYAMYWFDFCFDGRKYMTYSKSLRYVVNTDDFKDIEIILPPLEEQIKIANFLDEKVSEIDKVIEKTKETIEDYKKYKQTIINKAVTKGIKRCKTKEIVQDCSETMSTEFEIKKIKNVCDIYGRIGFRGYTQSDLVSEGEGAITLSPSNFNNMKMNYNKCSYLSWKKYEESPEIQINDGDIIFVKTGSTYGKSCLVKDLPMEATINPQMIVLKNINMDKTYFIYFLQSSFLLFQVEQSVVGGTIPTISQEKINNYIVIFPNLQNQKEIVEFLNKKCLEIDNLIKNKENLITELENYKKSLIYEYVTGKKEVKSSNYINDINPRGIKVNCKDNIFAQAILLCKIIEELSNYNLGRVKAEKTLYLIEKNVGFDFCNNYAREKAGPLAEPIYKCETIISKKNKWVKVKNVNKHIEYEILSDFNKYKKYYNNYYSDYDDKIEKVIEIIKNCSTDKAEMIATLYASWNDFIIKGEQVSDIQIVKDVRENWNDTKKRFSEKKWIDVLNEMKQIGLTPKGNGNLTIIKEQ